MSDPCFVAVGASGQIARTLDNGDTWEEVGPGTDPVAGLPDGYTPEFVSVDTDGSGVWLACGEYTGIWRSTDNAATWAPVAGTYTDSNLTSPRWQWLCYCGANTWLANPRSLTEIYRSTDNGATWGAIAHGVDIGGSPRYLYQIVADTESGIVWSTTGFSNDYGARSTDRGATWSAVTQDPDNFTQQYSLSFVNGSFVGANVSHVYLSSTAAEGSWTSVIWSDPSELGGGIVGRIVFDGTVYWCAHIAGKGILRSATLNSAVWEYLDPDGTDRNPDFVATDGAGVTIFVGEYNAFTPEVYSGLYRANSDLTTDTLTPPVGDTDHWHSIAYGGSAAPAATPRSWLTWW